MRENGILRFTGFTEEIIYASFPHHCLVCSSLVNTIKEDQNSTLVSISFRFCQRVLILKPSHAVCKGEKPSDVEQRLLVFTRVRDSFYGLPCRDLQVDEPNLRNLCESSNTIEHAPQHFRTQDPKILLCKKLFHPRTRVDLASGSLLIDMVCFMMSSIKQHLLRGRLSQDISLFSEIRLKHRNRSITIIEDFPVSLP